MPGETSIDAVIDYLLGYGGRIDAIVWDTQDSRHDIPNRCDTKNFERMYFHLHKTVMGRRPHGSHWHLRPDECMGIDWATLEDCLKSVGAWRRYIELPIIAEEYSIEAFRIGDLKQVSSAQLPLCQLADLFAGMAAYTRTRPEAVRQALQARSGQVELMAAPHIALSNADRERTQVIAHLNERCKSLRLGVSLMTRGYLCTMDPQQPLNFWHYVPQHPRDIAPTKDR